VSEKVVHLIPVDFKFYDDSIVDFSEPLCVDFVVVD
jgi:hypothetical protein